MLRQLRRRPRGAQHELAAAVRAYAAQALLEEVLYDADGNPLTSTLADYAAISPTDLPSFELVASETPTDLNPLGVKGIGEAGTIGSTSSGCGPASAFSHSRCRFAVQSPW